MASPFQCNKILDLMNILDWFFGTYQTTFQTLPEEVYSDTVKLIQ